jgi:hypothetical protein
VTVEFIESAHAPADPFGPSPRRRAHSVRRTSTIDSVWPQGIAEPKLMQGRARDIYTVAADSAPLVLAEDWMRILASPRREIIEIVTSRCNDVAQELIGQRGGGYLRGELARLLPDELAAGSPLNLLLDDFSGASLVAGWAWSRWSDDWMERQRQVGNAGPGRNGVMTGICTGFRPGSTALREDGSSDPVSQSSAIVPPLPRPDDIEGWHALDEQEGVGMRRARRIDVWLEDGLVQIDVGFQDSATSPKGGPDRIAIHEYHVTATADPETFALLSVRSEPRVLPYRECPSASPNVTRMIGTQLTDMRLAVPRELAGIAGCTHLNDVLRSISDVPQLVGRLREEMRETV